MASIHTKVINLQGIFPAKSLFLFTDNLLFPWVFHLKFNEVDLHQLSSMTAVDARKRFFEVKAMEVSTRFLPYPAEQRNTITSHDSFRGAEEWHKKERNRKNWEYQSQREISLSKIGQLKAAFCILCRIDLPSAMKIVYEKGRRRKNGLLRIRKSQNTRGGSRIINLFAFCCNQTVSIDASLCIPLVILASFSIFK